jgi:hypothetical protein
MAIAAKKETPELLQDSFFLFGIFTFFNRTTICSVCHKIPPLFKLNF